MEFDILTLLILFIIGVFAGFVDSIAGGGGIITLPALLAAGISPHQALATNKLQSSFGSFSAAYNYSKKGFMNPKDLILGIIFTFIGAVGGAISVQFFDAKSLESMIIIMLIIIFIYTLISPNLGKVKTKAKLKREIFFIIFGLLIGFYDGFFGPGTGSFWTMTLILLLGLDLKSATAKTKLFNFTSNIASLIIFIKAGLVLWSIGIIMGIGQIIGAVLGSNLVIKKEIKFIRIFFLLVVGATIIKLLIS